jgi:hypothetical protein
MKWIVLGVLLALIPALTVLLRSQPKFLVHACYFMGLLVFFEIMAPEFASQTG